MIKKNMTLAAIMMAALLGTGMFTTTSVYAGEDENKYNGDGGDSSETNTEQKLRQENFGDGTNTNCGQNLINSEGVVCFDPTDETGGDGGDGVLTCEECIAALEAELSVADLALVATILDTIVCDTLTPDGITTLGVTLTGLVSAEGDLAVADFIDCLLASLV
jgi:hypothetical protein